MVDKSKNLYKITKAKTYFSLAYYLLLDRNVLFNEPIKQSVNYYELWFKQKIWFIISKLKLWK